MITNRRTFLGRAAYGLGGMALACLLEPKLVGAAQADAPQFAQWHQQRLVVFEPHDFGWNPLPGV